MSFSPQIRRRAIHAFRLLSPFEPEILQKCLQQLPSRLKDTDADVKLSALPLLEVCFEVRAEWECSHLNDFYTNFSDVFNRMATSLRKT